MAGLRRHRSIRAAFGITVGVLAWISIASYWTTFSLQRAFGDVTRTYQALEKFQTMEVLLEAATASVSSYVISGEADRLNAFEYAKLMVPTQIEQINLLLPVRREKQAAIQALAQQTTRRLKQLETVIRLRQTDGQAAATRAIQLESGVERDQMERQLSEIQQEYLNVLKVRESKTSTRAIQTKALLAIATLVSLILIGWSYLLLRRESQERELAVSAKDQTEALLHTVIERMPYMVLLRDAEHLRITLANKTAALWLGQDAEDLQGALEADVRPEAEAIASVQSDRQALGLGRGVDLQERLQVEGKPERVLHTQKIPLQDEEGKPVYLLSISEDITEQKQAERMLEISRDAALEAARLRSEFIRNMSHELRTPLSIVMGMSSLLHDTTLTAEQKKFVQTIRKSAEGLSGLTKNILDFSRIETGSFSIENREINVLQITDSVVAMMTDQAKTKNVGLVTLASPEVPQILRGDASRISQILTQLVSNAVKFTERGQISVRMSLARQSDTQARVQWQITDTGIGISEEVQKHLFEPFRQGDGSWTRRYGGTGLGLAMVRRIVELLGGDIACESAPGMGSTFRFWIPLQKRHVRGPAVEVHTLPWSRAHVLLVSENEITRQSIRQQLNDCALSCETAASGQAALEILRRDRKAPRTFSLVLLDMHLADMDAVHLAKAIKNDADLQTLKLALMMSDKTVLEENTATALGFVGTMRIPCTPQDFYGQLAKWMDPGEPSRRRQVA